MDRRRFFGASFATAAALSLSRRESLASDLPSSAIVSDLAAVTGSGGKTVIAKSDLQALKDSLRGALLLPGSPGYEEARHVINDAIDRHPALVVQPSGPADVRTAVDFARTHALLLAVKCGGHSQSGQSTCDGGLQIDLSRLRGVRIDAATRTAYVAGGSLLGDIDHEAMAAGLVTTAGTVSHTGVAGLTLGGGFGRLARRFGLAADNVKAVDIVTADGQLRHASAHENPDLYWGVRGGGGNFGVVTGFEFALHPMQRQVLGGSLVFPATRARELLAFYGEYSLRATDELYADCVLTATPGKPAVFVFNLCYSGPPGRADAVLAPLRKLGPPLADTLKATDYVAIQRGTDKTDARIETVYERTGFIDGFRPELIAALAEGFLPNADRKVTVYFQHGGGLIGRVPVAATAFPHRRATHNMLLISSWPGEADPVPGRAYVDDYWRTLAPFTDGFYMNEVSDESASVVEANYQGNLSRMRSLKAKFDPGNLFRLNPNVAPET
jgi:hypothetical protein